jgi:hypothetical protein
VDTARRGDWIETYTGKHFYPFDPRIEEVDIIDIAHALSNICRYNGHCRYHYSVAQHSIYIARELMKMGAAIETVLAGLLHDAAEAYFGDIPRPIKRSLHSEEIYILEMNIRDTIFDKYLPGFNNFPAQVRKLDNDILFVEGDQLMNNTDGWWIKDTVDMKSFPGLVISYWSAFEAEQQFLKLFYELTEEIKHHE